LFYLFKKIEKTKKTKATASTVRRIKFFLSSTAIIISLDNSEMTR